VGHVGNDQFQQTGSSLGSATQFGGVRDSLLRVECFVSHTTISTVNSHTQELYTRHQKSGNDASTRLSISHKGLTSSSHRDRRRSSPSGHRLVGLDTPTSNSSSDEWSVAYEAHAVRGRLDWRGERPQDRINKQSTDPVSITRKHAFYRIFPLYRYGFTSDYVRDFCRCEFGFVFGAVKSKYTERRGYGKVLEEDGDGKGNSTASGRG